MLVEQISRADVSDYMRVYAIDNHLLKQPQRELISSFKLGMENILTVITPLPNFHPSLWMKRTKIFRFVHYTTKHAATSLSGQLLMLEELEMKILNQAL